MAYNKDEMTGHPPTYKDPEELEKKIQEYFATIELTDKPITISGLCYHCGFESRQSFYDYEKRDKFSYTIKRARFAIEVSYEAGLHTRTPAGSIFALKNLGWTDNQQITHDINYSDISDDELISRINRLLKSGSKD